MNGYFVIVIFCYNIAFAFFLHDLVCSPTKLALATAATTIDYEKDEANMAYCSTQPCHAPCPSDSVRADGGECRCLMSKCMSEVVGMCPDGFFKKRIYEATQSPGSCCHVDECVLENNATAPSKCDVSQCQRMEPCPADSYPIGVTVSADGCCFLHQGCQCLPKCDAVTCPSTTIPVIELEPIGEPGRCCPIYRCDHDLAVEMKNPELPDFAGCITNDHGLVKHNFSWSTQDSCVTCICQDGMVHCITPTCKPCPKWIVVPTRGQCCPDCEDHYEPEDCFPQSNCTEVCLYGNEIDEDGCVTCKCKSDKINISSDYDAAANPKVPVYSKANSTSKTIDCDKHKCEDGNTVCFEQLCLQSCSGGNQACCPICPGYTAQPRNMITVLFLTTVVAVVFIIVAVCTAKHCRYRRQQITLREFSRGTPYYQYVPAGPFDFAHPQKVQINSVEKSSVVAFV